jgi:DNA polymerase (family 10)
VDQRQVSRLFAEIAEMMELAGENRFKIRAYENAAHAIAGLPGDLAEAVRSGELRELKGVGDKISAQIQTLLATGRLPLHEELRARFPPGLRDCLGVPGLGASKVRLLHQTLGVDSLETLESACRDGRLLTVAGFGAKSVEKILHGIAMRRAGTAFHRFHRAWIRARELVSALENSGLVSRIEVAGSLRRRRELARDVDIVAAAPDPEALRAAFSSLPEVEATVESSPAYSRVLLAGGIAADLFTVSEDRFGATLLRATGTSEHWSILSAEAARMGLELGENGLRTSGARDGTGHSEQEIYAKLGMSWIPPELRESSGEIEAAKNGSLPRLVAAEDLRGLIHVHTTDSDGRDTLERMVDAVRAAGFGYVAITDHSQNATYAHGMTTERALLQRARLRSLSERYSDFRIFHGTEADILADGSIDYGDTFLEGFDVVVASIHSRFGLSREEQTRRLVRAVQNPRVTVLGHPSGRLLLSRDPLPADWEAVFEAAGRSGCAIEFNCNPERLDLDWRLCRQAMEAGVLLSIGPDAHSAAELVRVADGVQIARKGWVTAASVLNTKSATDLEEWLARRRGKPLPD